jgi:hypothetical protein
LHELLEPSLRRFELITGPRRVGKTTLMYQLVADLISRGVSRKRIQWLRLDHPMFVDEPLSVLMRVLIRVAESADHGPVTSENPIFVFLDEVLYAKDWARWLKTFYDDKWPVRIVATGSATAALRQEHRESGVGRWREWYLSPLLFHDFLRIQDVDVQPPGDSVDWLTTWRQPRCELQGSNLIDRMQQYVMLGGFPELAVKAAPTLSDNEVFRSQQALREYAIDRAIYKDLTQAYDIQNPMALEKLLYALAGQVCGLMRVDALAKTAGISQPTVEAYLKYLEEAGLILMLRNYAASEEAIQRRGRKIFFTDSAMRNAALQRGSAPLQDPAELGMLYENTVAGHLEAYCRARQHRLFHWRQKQDEVDFIIGHPTDPTAIEVGSRPKHSTRGLSRLLKTYSQFGGRGWLLSPTATGVSPSPDSRSPKPGTAPLAYWLLACGLAADAALTQME